MCNLGTQHEKDREDVMHVVTIFIWDYETIFSHHTFKLDVSGASEEVYNIVRQEEDAVDIH